MEELLDAILKMEENGVCKNEMIVVLNSEYAKKYLKETNDILETPITQFRTVYGVDVIVVGILTLDSKFYIFTKEYWGTVVKFYE